MQYRAAFWRVGDWGRFVAQLRTRDKKRDVEWMLTQGSTVSCKDAWEKLRWWPDNDVGLTEEALDERESDIRDAIERVDTGRTDRAHVEMEVDE